MPVHLEHIEKPSEQDWIDLGKIYADAPQEWLSNPSDHQQSLQVLLDEGSWLIAGRFNSRLLGAMKASKENNVITLQHFCVRNVTKGRGVAHQMLHHINRWADAEGYTLVALEVPEELANSLISREFELIDNKFIRNPR